MTEQAAPTTPPTPARQSIARRALRALGRGLTFVALAGVTGWMTLAVHYASLSGAPPRRALAVLVLLASIAPLLLVRRRRYGLAAFAAIFCIVLGWYFSLKPSNDRDWAIDVSRLPSVEVQGSRITVHNLRNFEYRSETDFTPAWRDQSYDLDKIQSVDFALCYWGSKAIAHGIVSFGFADGQHLAISIETRRETPETYSAVQGFFRQYELIYILADERDVLKLRTNFRHEDVYLYRARGTPEHARAILLSYVESVNALRDQPQWYNALTTNCITSVVPHARAGRPTAHNSWRTLLSGYAARQAYDNGVIDTRLPFEQLESRSRINDAAVAAADDPDFSSRIRAGLPNPADDAPQPHS